MHKPGSLRDTLVAALARHKLNDDPARLHMAIVNGRPRALARAGGPAFEFAYTLRLTLLDFAGDPAEVIFPLLFWIQRWQHELLQNHDKARDGIEIELDLLDNKKVDVMIDLPLTERVRLNGDGVIEYPEEPIPPAFETGAPLHRVYADGEILGACAHQVEG